MTDTKILHDTYDFIVQDHHDFIVNDRYDSIMHDRYSSSVDMTVLCMKMHDI